MFSSRFDKEDEYDQVLEVIEIIFNLNINQNFTKSDIDKNDIQSQLKKQLQLEQLHRLGLARTSHL